MRALGEDNEYNDVDDADDGGSMKAMTMACLAICLQQIVESFNFILEKGVLHRFKG